ncbi:hypothetical protein [Bacillus sp. SM2101]|uniref:hypothetical protein n=1 Tax=Bacillus sp. SM2101 TaxID=2805366 RepID=UPI001BDECF62|nr:hypothetical protein [Bacillus sp. SM2101]
MSLVLWLIMAVGILIISQGFKFGFHTFSELVFNITLNTFMILVTSIIAIPIYILSFFLLGENTNRSGTEIS